MSLPIEQIPSHENDAKRIVEKLRQSFVGVGQFPNLFEFEGKRKWKMTFLQLDSSFPSDKIFSSGEREDYLRTTNLDRYEV